jgi:hypothetical protein
MIDSAFARFDIRGARVIHRVGRLRVSDQIVLVAVSSAHRGEAFQACEFLMDYLKTQAPFWKKETTAEGERWVDARVADDAALARWGIAAGNAHRPGPGTGNHLDATAAVSPRALPPAGGSTLTAAGGAFPPQKLPSAEATPPATAPG